MAKVVALVAAAGQGKRMGAQCNKQFLAIGDRPVLAWTISVFQACPMIDEIIVMASPGEEEYCRQEIIAKYNFNKVKQVITGGLERQDSIYNGLQALSDGTDIVVVHDGARPLVTMDLINKSITEAQNHGAAIVAVKAKDTIKLGDDQGLVNKTLNRSFLWQVQTPQTFKYSLIVAAYQNAISTRLAGTDDASLVEALGKPVKLVDGSYENLKITTPEDLEIAKVILRKRGLI